MYSVFDWCFADAHRIGIFTSATIRTCAAAVDMLEAAAGDGLIFERGLVMHRDHTVPVSKGGYVNHRIILSGRCTLHRVMFKAVDVSSCSCLDVSPCHVSDSGRCWKGQTFI